MKNRDWDKIHKRVEELEQFVWLENTELGEACEYLICLINKGDYISDEFLTACIKEAEEQLQYFQENFDIVEEEKTSTSRVTILREKDF